MATAIGLQRSPSTRTHESIAIFEDEQEGAHADEEAVVPSEHGHFTDDLSKHARNSMIRVVHKDKLHSNSDIEDFDPEEDPFTESEDDEDDGEGYEEHGLVEEQDGYIGGAPSYRISHGYDRSFSTTTAIHLEDPDHDQLQSRHSDSWAKNLTNHLEGIAEDGPKRLVSESLSAMPEDLEYAGRSSGGQYTSSPDRRRNSRSPAKDHPFGSPNALRNGFRNSSSIKNMQLSSPSPTPYASPPSAGRRYGTRISPSHKYSMSRQSSVMNTPSRHHVEPQKEYPLVLLHCSISGASIPYSQAALDTILPTELLDNVRLLRQKLSATVVERGVLIPHPGDDYELLEERVLESLELKRPRLGKCGHFNAQQSAVSQGDGGSTAVQDAKSTLGEEAHGPEHFDGAVTCPDCGGHTCSDVSETGCDSSRKWDIRVYAANGLMRAGAWAAAWREMEKVDVEVGPFIPERYRRDLDSFTAMEAKEALERGAPNVVPVDIAPPPAPVQTAPESTNGPIPMARQRSTSSPTAESASTAACARPQSRRSSNTKSRNTNLASSGKSEMPLSVLLERYVRRNIANRPDVLIGIFILMIGLWFTSRGTSSSSSAISSSVLDGAVPSAVVSEAIGAMASSISSILPSAAVSQEAGALPACTFASSEADLHGMTALPSSIALHVLEDIASPLASVPSSVPGSSEDLSSSSSSSEKASQADSATDAIQTSDFAKVVMSEASTAADSAPNAIADVAKEANDLLLDHDELAGSDVPHELPRSEPIDSEELPE